MGAGDTARKHYESARAELIERIRLRETVLLIYLGAIGAVFGMALGTPAQSEILLVIPYLALGASAIVSQHHNMIGFLGDFLAHEIEPFLKGIGEYAPQWDTSEALKSSLSATWLRRALGHLILIDIPPIIALILNWRHSFPLAFPAGLFWWIGVVFTGISIWVIWDSHLQRKRLYQRLRSKRNDEADKGHSSAGAPK